MPEDHRIYFDNAATSWPKPRGVLDEVARYLNENGAPAGRGAYNQALEVQHRVQNVRLQLAQHLSAPTPESIVFSANGTDSLNLAIHGILRPGDHVITSAAEHNSVLRPLEFLRQSADLEYSIVPCDSHGRLDPADFANAVRPNTKLIAVTAASNVTGTMQPIREISEVAHAHEAIVLVDAAQLLGHAPCDVARLEIDLLAGSAHKGLLGILGLGVLYVKPSLQALMRPLRQGGTGTQSANIQQPQEFPQQLESGNLNVPGIIALGEGLDYLNKVGIQQIAEHEQHLTQHLLDGLQPITGIQVYGSADASHQVGVVSLNFDELSPQDAAAVLDAQFGIQVRAGFHCSPLIHPYLDSEKYGGTVRFSVGPFNTLEQVSVVIESIRQLATCSTQT